MQAAHTNTQRVHVEPETRLVFRQGFGWVERPVEQPVETEQVWRQGFGWVTREVGR